MPIDAGNPVADFARRLRATLGALAWPPGRLTVAWRDGERARFLPPLQTMLLVNLAFFLVQSAVGLRVLGVPLDVHLHSPWTGALAERLFDARLAASGRDRALVTAVFDAMENVHSKSLVILMLPPFALLLWCLLPAARRRFGEAFVFSTHFFAWQLLYLTLLFPLSALVLALAARSGWRADPADIDLAISALEGTGFGVWLSLALRRVFGMSRPRGFLTMALMLCALFALLHAYRFVVFLVTLYTL